VELWAQILSLLGSGVAEEIDLSNLSTKYTLGQQSSFHRLRLVCKRFNDVFLEYPDICRHLVFRQQQADTLNPNLVAWLKRYHTSVQTLTAYCCNSALIHLLDMLASNEYWLQSVLVQNHFRSSLPSFAPFAHLTTLEVVSPRDSFLDLSTLQLSNSLRTLVVQDGTFTTGSLPPNLTNLYVADSDVESYQHCSCVTSLMQLKLWNSTLCGLHQHGVLACHALEGLTCLESYVSAVHVSQELCFNINVFRMPLGLSALTSLRCFDAKIASTSTLTLNVFCELTSLQDLKIHVRGGSLWANTGMSQLSVLTSLSLLASAGRKDVGVQIFMEWLGMQALQVLNITCDYFSFGRDILGLVNLKRLRQVNIVSGRPNDNKTAAFFAALVHGVAQHPCAQLCMNGLPVGQVLADGLQYCTSSGDIGA